MGKFSVELNIWANTKDRQRLVAGLKKHGVVENLEAKFTDKNGQIKTGLMPARILLIDSAAPANFFAPVSKHPL